MVIKDKSLSKVFVLLLIIGALIIVSSGSINAYMDCSRLSQSECAQYSLCHWLEDRCWWEGHNYPNEPVCGRWDGEVCDEERFIDEDFCCADPNAICFKSLHGGVLKNRCTAVCGNDHLDIIGREQCDTNPGQECSLSAPYDYDTSNGIISCQYCASNCGGWITKEAGYCGDGKWQSDYEECDPTIHGTADCKNNCIWEECEPTLTCTSQGYTCGSFVDDCGDTINCGSCGTGETCSNNQCITPDSGCPQTKDCSGLECGTDPVCGESCGTCQTGYTCQSGNCVQNPAPEYCGDGICNNGETCSSCSADCGTCPPANCELTSAVWSADNVTENEQVQLIVNGNSCDGVTVAFEVYEDDLLGDDPANIQPNNAIFSSGVAIGTWTTEWQEDVTGDPEYYFRASTNPTIRSSDPLLITTQDTSYCITTPIDLCSDYTGLGQSKCELDSCGAIENSIPEGVDCGAEGVDCACTWRWETSECSASYSSGEIGTCYLRETGQADNCDDGFLSYSWTAIWEWASGNFVTEDPESEDYIYDSEAQGWRYDPINPFKGYRKSEQCVEGSNIIACPAQIQLSFFDKYNFLAVIVLIVLIYIIIEAVNRNKKMKKRRVSRRKKK